MPSWFARQFVAESSGRQGGWFRAFSALLAGEASAVLARTVAVIWIIRQIGPEGFGVVGVGLAVSGFLQIASGGVTTIGTRTIVADRANIGRHVATVTGLRFAISLGVLAVAGVVLLMVDLAANERLTIFIFCSTVVTNAFHLRWLFIAVERTGAVAASTGLGSVVYLFGALVFVREASDLVVVAVLHLVADGVQSLGGVLASIRLIGRWRPRVDRAAWRVVIVGGIIITITKAARALMATIDVVLVQSMVSTTEAGIYAAPRRISGVILIPVGLFVESALPTFVRSAGKGTSALAAARHRAVRLISISGVPIALLGIVMAPLAVPLVLGDEFSASATVLQILFAGMVVTALAGPFHQSLNAVGAERDAMFASLLGLAVSLAANLLLIPPHGANGAAAADVLARIVFLAAVLAAIRRISERDRVPV